MASINRYVFPYTIAGGQLSPMVPAALHVGGKWFALELYVDSGAAFTILQAQVAQAIGLNFRAGKKVLVQVGDGSLIPVFLHNLNLQIGGRSFRAPICFSEKLGVPFNLLGRHGVFEHFHICFHERQKAVSFRQF